MVVRSNSTTRELHEPFVGRPWLIVQSHFRIKFIQQCQFERSTIVGTGIVKRYPTV